MKVRLSDFQKAISRLPEKPDRFVHRMRFTVPNAKVDLCLAAQSPFTSLVHYNHKGSVVTFYPYNGWANGLTARQASILGIL